MLEQRQINNGLVARKQKQPGVAIVVLNWNGFAITKECLRSIQGVNYLNYKVIIVDNNSTDGSQKRFRTEFPEHHLIINKKNLGFPEGNNVGIRRALNLEFKYVFLLNYDTIIQPDSLSKLVSAAEKHGSIGMVGPCIRYYSKPNNIWSLGGYIGTYTNRPWHRTIESERNEIKWVSACAMLVKLDIIKIIGLMDSGYFFGTEDVDWCLRAMKAGFRIVVVRDAIIYHKTPVSRFEKKCTPFHNYYHIRNLLMFIKKNNSFCWLFWLSFLNTLFKRIAWSILSMDFRALMALWLGIRDFRKKNFGDAAVKYSHGR